VPDFAFFRQHEKDQERDECALQHERVKRANAANDQIVHRARVARGCGRLGSRFRAGDLGDAAFDAADFLLHFTGGPANDLAIFRPVRGEVGGAQPERVAHGDENQNQQDNEDQGADGAGNSQALHQFHHGIQKISDQHREQNRDHHARGVIEEQKENRGGNQPQAEIGAGDAEDCSLRRFRCGHQSPLSQTK